MLGTPCMLPFLAMLNRHPGTSTHLSVPATALSASTTDVAFTCSKLTTMLCRHRSGGVQGGISNGEDIVLRVAFKPTATISRNQKTVNRKGEDIELRARGRHDPCVVPRAVPMVEAMVAMVLADHALQHFAQCELFPRHDALGPDTKVQTQFQNCEGSIDMQHA